MLAKDWYDLGPTGSIRSWPSNAISPDPYHAGPRSPLRDLVPNGDCPRMIKVDLAHTYAISGFGKDELASTLVLLACRCRVWGGNNIPDQLNAAYVSFYSWCSHRKKTSTIKSFDKEELKITSSLVWTSHDTALQLISLIPLPLKVFLTMSPLNLVPTLRLQQFPRGLGKGSDAALVGRWLQTAMAEMDENMIPATCWSCSAVVVKRTCFISPCYPVTEANCRDLFKVAKWGCNSTNSFFRTLYCGKLWLTREEAEAAVFNGWNMVDTFLHFLVAKISCMQNLWHIINATSMVVFLRKLMALAALSVPASDGPSTM